MKKFHMYRPLMVSLAAIGFTVAMPAAALDADAAKTLFKDNECGKCHHEDKDKKGPALKTTANKKDYKGKPDAVDKIIKHMTSGKKIKFKDGTEDDHKIVDTKDPAALKNLAQWILSH